MKKLILVIGLWVIASSAFCQTKDSTAYSFSLKQAIDFAMQNQNDVKNAMIDEEMAREKVHETRGLGLPQINSSFDVKDFLEIPTTVLPNFVSPAVYGGLVQAGAAPYDPVKMSPDGYAPMEAKFGTQYQATAGFDGSQLLFNAEYFVGLKATKVYMDIAYKSTQRTRIEATAAVSKAYYLVLINAERTKLMDANVARIKKTMEDTKALMENGFVEKIDYDRLVVTYNNMLVEQEKIQRLLNVGMYLLKYQMGMAINASLTLTDKLEDIKFDANISSDKFDYSKRVEYNLLEGQYTMAKFELKRQKFSYLPNAYAYGSLSAGAFRSTFSIFNTDYGWYPTALVGATVKMPIFTGLQRNAKRQQAKLSLQKAENNMNNIKSIIDLDIASSTTTLTNASSSFENQKKNIAIAEEVARVVKIKYEQGVGSNLELITAETSLKEAQANYYNALYDAIIAKLDFDKANGNLK